jgi:hypothetical protein
MEETIEGKLIAEIAKIDKRIEYLKTYKKEYAEDNDLENARICHIKARQLKLVSESLKEIIK